MTTTYQQAKTEALQARISHLEWVVGMVISTLEVAERESKDYAHREGHGQIGAMYWSSAFGWLSGSVTSALSTAKVGLEFGRE
jgi:tetrahydromethanopterin S-methyltransferase subunit B